MTELAVDNGSIADVLGEHGPFNLSHDNYVVRSSQIEMAQQIQAAIENNETLVAESGTGTGKTYAYLVPALLSDKKVLISTGTKHLQEQLFHRDIPLVLKTLNLSVKIALLKGRSNYLCLHRYHQTKYYSRRLEARELTQLEAITSWVPKTSVGDVAELTDVPEDSKLWSQVTSTVDNCLGQDCKYFEDCHVNKARKKAISSHAIVVNHHLFFADKALKEDGFGSLLPDVDTVIFDEAHQIPDIASNFLGRNFSSWQVLELANDTRIAERQEKSLVADLLLITDELDKLIADYRLGLGLQERRVAWLDLVGEVPNLPKSMTTLANKLTDLSATLEKAAVAGEALTRCYERALELSQLCHSIAGDYDNDSVIRWVEISRRTFRIHETPLNIGSELSSYFGNRKQSRIFTSATLSVDGDFSHYNELVGLSSDTKTKTWESPFNYFEQAVLYVPEGLPSPKEDEFADEFYEHALPLIENSNGRAFVLFTSFRLMQAFHDRISEMEFNVLMQGDTNKRDLINNFIQQPKSVLLGTMSFWEGVDVPGEALSTVIIDKLPFESPYEPVLKARLTALEESGENPFMNYQVPRAVITLRQGAGRLIRSQQDKGVLMIGDSRLRSTHYGKIFLNSLPRMRRTSDQSKVVGFLKSLV